MALVTLCPECNTTFRVTSEQLKVHSGDVRCGQCLHVFNSFATLVTVEESEISYTSEIELPVFTEDSFETESKAEASHEVKTAPASQESFDYFPEENTAAYIGDDDEVNFDSAPAKEKWDFSWFVANGIFLFLLIGQIVYFYRVEISVALPDAKPVLMQYCAILNCTVPFSSDISLLNIESSSLYTDPARQSEITTLNATIRNYASFPQALPAFKLSLTDARGKLLASRIFSADDYLDENTNSIQSIAPNNEINIKLYYQSDELKASGYQLLLLYL